ncbi:MAG: hypothetical protein C4B58_07415 [Deltaproteobacteria bacterium]|nr:MAG: hypothetical protein C4B58_07415 [Deltaproteobacteria bacterium]
MLKMFTHTVSMIILVLKSIGLAGCASAESANIGNGTEHTAQQSQHSDNDTLADQHSSAEEANETVTQDTAALETAQNTTIKVVVKAQGGDEELVLIQGANVFVKSGDGQEFSAKTNSKGVAVLLVIPRGKIKVQVTASGFKTFGERYELVEKEESIEIELEIRDLPIVD